MRLPRRTRTGLVPHDIEPFGDAALRFAAADARTASALAAAVRGRAPRGMTDAVGGSESVLVAFDPAVTSWEALAEDLRALRAERERPRGATHTIAVSLDGPDLDEVGRLSGLDRQALRRALLGCTLRVAFLGFAPGFAYLDGLARPLDRVPRRASPRPVVPAGALALGGGRAAIYPCPSPGGWHLVGRTAVSLFDPARPPYALLAPGDRIRLHEVPPDALGAPPGDQPAVGRHGDPVFSVESPGFYSALQDRGRPGFAHLGVSASGAADPVSCHLANRLLGNESRAACLEITASGPTLLCRRPTFVAVVGGAPEVLLDGRPVGRGRVVPVEPGQRLAIGPTGWSMRSYLAVRGGFDGPLVLGSRSTDRLGGLGPPPLEAGDELAARAWAGAMADHLAPGAAGQEPPPSPVRLRVLPAGTDWSSWEQLCDREFEVARTSDRVGVRLRPAGAGVEGDRDEVPSGGVTAGVVQVPPSGEPVVLGADHATHGGYPVAAVVISADVSVLGRCRPGDRVRFVAVAPEEAIDAGRTLRRAVAGSVAGSYPTAVG